MRLVEDMRLKTLLGLYSIVAAIICVNFIAAPSLWIALYGGSVDPQATLLFRLIGALFGGLAIMADREKDSVDPRGSVVSGLIVANGFATIVALFGAFSGVYNRLAWGPVFLFAGFAVGLVLSSRTRQGIRLVDRERAGGAIALHS